MQPAAKRPKKSQESLLFHPKKKSHLPGERQASSSPQKSANSRPSPPISKPSPAAKSEPDTEVDDLKLPTTGYQEFRLMSSALNGWKYDVMKFDSRKPIDISTWQPPIKLNRKELRRDETGSQAAVPAGPMLGSDGKPVIGSDGSIVMIDAEGRPIQNGVPPEASGSSNKDLKGKAFVNTKRKFQKKTRQVFLVPEATRQLRREERYPWVMEDAPGKEIWVGKMEDLSKSETHAFFMPAANDVFKFVPAHRWYKFYKKPAYHIPNLEEAESIVGLS
jgi:transcription initiation factor TFIIF subunit alpha